MLSQSKARTERGLISFLRYQILRIKANDRAEVESYLNELSSVRAGAAKVTTVRTQAVCAWDFVWF